MIRQTEIVIAFNDFGRLLTRIFLFRIRFYFQFSPRCPKISKTINMGCIKKIIYKISVPRTRIPTILRFLGAETMNAKHDVTSRLNLLIRST